MGSVLNLANASFRRLLGLHVDNERRRTRYLIKGSGRRYLRTKFQVLSHQSTSSVRTSGSKGWLIMVSRRTIQAFVIGMGSANPYAYTSPSSLVNMWSTATKSRWPDFIKATCFSVFVGNQTSSPSRKAMNSVVAASTPLLRAAPAQPGGRRTTRSPGNASDTSSIQAFDSKTTTMVSHSTV